MNLVRGCWVSLVSMDECPWARVLGSTLGIPPKAGPLSGLALVLFSLQPSIYIAQGSPWGRAWAGVESPTAGPRGKGVVPWKLTPQML